MSTALTTDKLVDKCKEWILEDRTSQDKDILIQDAIITSSREIGELAGPLPMAWNREVYDEIFTKYYAEISDITSANPGVITAETVDPDVSSGHGFVTNDIVWIDGIGTSNLSDYRLNRRYFIVTKIDSTTLSLLALDGNRAIDTSGYETYDSGGIIYHAGTVLSKSDIEPSDSWTMKRVWQVTFDGLPTKFVTQQRAKQDGLMWKSGIPKWVNYEKRSLSTFVESNINHLLFWWGFPSQRLNVEISLEKSYPDISIFNSSTYPPHPIELHDYIWHRALSNLATQSDRMKRKGSYREGSLPGDNTKMEIVNGAYWIAKAQSDEIKILAYHRSLLGEIPSPSRGMSA